jgi:hypothetical protein
MTYLIYYTARAQLRKWSSPFSSIHSKVSLAARRWWRSNGEPDMPRRSKLVTLPAESESTARLKAFQLLAAGFVVWRISGPNGFALDRARVEADYVKYELRT